MICDWVLVLLLTYCGLRGSGGMLPCSFFTSISLLLRSTSLNLPREPLLTMAPLPSYTHTHPHTHTHTHTPHRERERVTHTHTHTHIQTHTHTHRTHTQ